jgi:Sigma-70 region 2
VTDRVASPSALVGATRREAVGDVDDPRAFEIAAQPHCANLVRRLVLVLGDEQDAQDIAQETYLKAFRSWDRFDGADVRAWLYTIALRLALTTFAVVAGGWRRSSAWRLERGRTRSIPTCGRPFGASRFGRGPRYCSA